MRLCKGMGLLFAMVAWGCAHRVAIDSSPSGATVRLNDEPTALAPAEVVVRWTMLRPQHAELRLRGYREMDVKLTRRVFWRWLGDVALLRTGRLSGKKVRNEVHVVLMPTHDEAGTWNADDVNRLR